MLWLRYEVKIVNVQYKTIPHSLQWLRPLPPPWHLHFEVTTHTAVCSVFLCLTRLPVSIWNSLLRGVIKGQSLLPAERLPATRHIFRNLRGWWTRRYRCPPLPDARRSLSPSPMSNRIPLWCLAPCTSNCPSGFPLKPSSGLPLSSRFLWAYILCSSLDSATVHVELSKSRLSLPLCAEPLHKCSYVIERREFPAKKERNELEHTP